MAGNIVINNVFSEATLTEAAKVQQNFSQMEDEFANLTHFAPLVVQTDHIENDQSMFLSLNGTKVLLTMTFLVGVKDPDNDELRN